MGKVAEVKKEARHGVKEEEEGGDGTLEEGENKHNGFSY